jgi:hypothetical protein
MADGPIFFKSGRSLCPTTINCGATWVPYSGNSAIILGVVLLVIAGVFTLFGSKLEDSLRVKMPGKAIAGVLVAVWIYICS